MSKARHSLSQRVSSVVRDIGLEWQLIWKEETEYRDARRCPCERLPDGWMDGYKLDELVRRRVPSARCCTQVGNLLSHDHEAVRSQPFAIFKQRALAIPSDYALAGLGAALR